MNINEPISNPKLVSAIEGLSNNNATQQKFFEELAQAKLLCPADIQLQNSTRDGKEIVVGEGSSISVKHIEDTEGNKFLMAFTDGKNYINGIHPKNSKRLFLVIRIFRAS